MVGETLLLVKLISGTEGSNKVLKQKMALVLMFALLSAIMLYSQKTKETLEIIVFNCSRGNLFLQFKYLQLQSLVLNSTSSVTLLANMLNNLTWLYHPIPRITMSVRWFVPCPFFTPSNTHTHTHPSNVIIYLMFIFDLENLLSVWENVLSVAIMHY